MYNFYRSQKLKQKKGILIIKFQMVSSFFLQTKDNFFLI